MVTKRILDFQKRLVSSYKRQLKESLELDPSLKEYLAKQKKYGLDYERASFEDLLDSMLKSEVIGLGDWHEYDEAERLLLEIMDKLKRENGQVDLGLEAFLIGEEVKGTQSKKDLKRKMLKSFQKEGQDYRQLIREATKKGVEVYGISEEGKGLKERDQTAAKEISKRKGKQLVFIGEAHLCPDHLPAAIQKEKEGVKQTLILHNLEKIYFGLGLVDTPAIVRLNDSRKGVERFCIINGPPLENLYSLVYLALEPEEGKEFIEAQLDKVGEFLGKIFGLKYNGEEYTISVNQSTDQEDRQKLKESLGLPKTSKAILPTGVYREIAYAAKPNLTHLAQAAGGILFKEGAKRKGPWGEKEIKRETWSHLCSFLINPYWHFKSKEDFKEEAEGEGESLKERVAQEVVAYLKKGIFLAEEPIVQRWAAYRIGQIKGKKLYSQLIKGKVSPEEIKKEFFG